MKLGFFNRDKNRKWKNLGSFIAISLYLYRSLHRKFSTSQKRFFAAFRALFFLVAAFSVFSQDFGRSLDSMQRLYILQWLHMSSSIAVVVYVRAAFGVGPRSATSRLRACGAPALLLRGSAAAARVAMTDGTGRGASGTQTCFRSLHYAIATLLQDSCVFGRTKHVLCGSRTYRDTPFRQARIICFPLRFCSIQKVPIARRPSRWLEDGVRKVETRSTRGFSICFA